MALAMRMNAGGAGPKWMTGLKWVARAASVASIVMLAQFATSGGGMPTGKEWMALALFPIGVVIGMLMGWKSQLIGGCVTLVSLLGFHAIMYAYGRGGVTSMGPWFVIFSSPGLIMFVLGVVERIVNKAR